jgi:hypothetical protein
MSYRHFPSGPTGRARSRVPRSLVVVLLVLQALVWGGGSILEARAAAESFSRYSHVEDQSAKCPPIHSHLDCLICRTLNGGAVGGSSPAIEALAYLHDGTRVSDSEVPVECGRPGTIGSRGPPLV